MTVIGSKRLQIRSEKTIRSQGKVSEKSANFEMEIEWQLDFTLVQSALHA